MLIDLTPNFTRFNIERHPCDLIVLIPEGKIRGPLWPVNEHGIRGGKPEELTPVHEEPGLLGFRLDPGGGGPTYEDEDAEGWEYVAFIRQRGEHTILTLRRERPSGSWVVRMQGQLGMAFDVTLPKYAPSQEEVVPLGRENLRWRLLMADTDL